MGNHRNILKYWYNLEYFSPFWPEETDKTSYLAEDSLLPWQVEEKQVSFNVYLGKLPTDELLVKMLEAVGEKDERLEKDNAQSCLCGLKLSNEGRYVRGSYRVATFVWAIAQIIEQKSLALAIEEIELDRFNQQMDDRLMKINGPITYQLLENFFLATFEALVLTPTEFSGLINEKEPIDLEDDVIDTSIDMIPSFYTNDLKMIREEIKDSDRIVHYINAANGEKTSRIEIDNDLKEMKKWLSIERHPIGKWPSQHHPSLMQQLAINLAIGDEVNEANIFSVNGPPGTGKTTLLKEIIAHSIVERALKLITYTKPDDAFEQKMFVEPPNDYLKTYYQIDPDLTKYGMIVASNNNAAVENISKELPIISAVKKAHTELFDKTKHEEIYFSEIATSLMGADSWGLISARLGKKANINDLVNKLWFTTENKNLRQVLQETKMDWRKVKEDFSLKYEEFLTCRQAIAQKIEALHGSEQLKAALDDAQQKLDDIELEKNACEMKANALSNQIHALEAQAESLTQTEQQLFARIPWFKKWFIFYFKKDQIVASYLATKQEINEMFVSLPTLKSEAVQAKQQTEEYNKQYSEQLAKLQQQTKDYNELLIKIEHSKKEFGKNFADETFWSNIEQNEVSQEASPWTTKEFDKLREELFYLALQVQKAFVINSKSVKQNLNALVNMWSGTFSEQHKEQAYGTLLNTLFLVVPVCSTTFASVSRFLNYVKKEELGMLIIDESGQATPQSAIGALWRTQKAIIVGDPLQVEPVMTIPKQLMNTFATDLNLSADYRSSLLSVQQLADNLNPFGGYRETADGRIWLGCPLVIHRRCIEPMFSISNAIAYNNRMFGKTEPPETSELFLFAQSCWLDVKGAANGGKDHFVNEQGQVVLEHVIKAINLNKELPSLYIISPFKTVITNMKKILVKELPKADLNLGEDVKIEDWISSSCGTVHTFQGKEANEVILLLGCDQENGEGAANWASEKPNILNVAATRAKYRLAIIGDTNLWANRSHFDVAFKKISNDE